MYLWARCLLNFGNHLDPSVMSYLQTIVCQCSAVCQSQWQFQWQLWSLQHFASTMRCCCCRIRQQLLHLQQAMDRLNKGLCLLVAKVKKSQL